MKIQTLGIVVGTRACQAKCPFCISKMTGFDELPKGRAVNVRNFRKAAHLAERAGTTTVLMTGKGEPTLYPDEITHYLILLGNQFPLIELQTNALDIGTLAKAMPNPNPEARYTEVNGYVGDIKLPAQLRPHHLRDWYSRGLDTIAISTVGIDPVDNARVYLGDDNADYPDLATTVRYLHGIGFSVRLCVMMHKGGVDTTDKLMEVVDWCRDNQVEQVTFRPIRKPLLRTAHARTTGWVLENGIEPHVAKDIHKWVRLHATRLMTLMHGAEVFDIKGQNVCMSDCLTLDGTNSDIRTLIFFTNGRIAYDWQYEGAVLLGGQK